VRILPRILATVRGVFRPGALDAGVADELRFHLDRQIQANLNAGMSRDEATRAAHLMVGSLEVIREESRAARPGALLHQLTRDLLFGLRLLRRAPGLAAISALVVALGIGTTTAIFSVVYGVMLRPLQYGEPEQLVAIWTHLPDEAGARPRVNAADYRDWRDRTSVFEGAALGNAPQNFNLIGSGEPERVLAGRLSAGLLPVLRVVPALGRGFTAGEERIGGDRVVILGNALWRRRFAADPAILGRTINLSGTQYEVIGVMGPDFQFPGREHQLWIPLTIDPRELTRQVASYNQMAIARLRPGVRMEQAQRELDAIAAQLAADHPATNRGVRFEVRSLLEESVGPVRQGLYLMLAAVSCLLLIACFNLAGLLGTRAAGRKREYTVRVALGASRGRLALQAMAEIAPVLVLGGATGIAGARYAVAAFVPMAPAALPRVDGIGINAPVLVFSAIVLLLTGIIAGLLPVAHAWRANVPTAAKGMRSSTASRDELRARNALVIAQLALTLPLLVGATALVRTFAAVMRVDPGFHAENILTLHMAIPRTKYRNDQQIAAFYHRLLDRVGAVPGVASAAMINRLPLSGNDMALRFELEDVAGPQLLQFRSATPDYFRTMAIPLRAGRGLTEQDTASAPMVAVIDDRSARTLWPGQDPLGKRYTVMLPGNQPAEGTIVGVVGAVRHGGLDRADERQIYFSYHQFTDGRIVLLVRGRADVRSLVPSVRAAIQTVDPEQPLYDVRTMEDVVARSTAERWLSMAIVTTFALSSLLLASVGLYGVMAHGVTERTREFGVRLALGASRREVLRQVLRRGSGLAVSGAALGLGGAIALVLVMRSLLFGVSSLDPLDFLAAAALLFAVTLAASYLPARRAASTDPVHALRAE
jgi:putative ABC transport system permease protein